MADIAPLYVEPPGTVATPVVLLIDAEFCKPHPVEDAKSPFVTKSVPVIGTGSFVAVL